MIDASAREAKPEEMGLRPIAARLNLHFREYRLPELFCGN